MYLFETLISRQGLPKTLQYLAKPHFSIFLDKSYFEMFVGLPRTCKDLPSLNITKFKTRTNFAMMDDSMLSLSWPLVTCSRGREGWVGLRLFRSKVLSIQVVSIQIKSIRYLSYVNLTQTELVSSSSHHIRQRWIEGMSPQNKECHPRRRKTLFVQSSRNFFRYLNTLNNIL